LEAGDVCTRHFERVGFVVNYTGKYLEVRWTEGGGVEKIPADQIDDVLRVAHADSLSPSGTRTNLEALESFEALDTIQSALANKTFKSDREKRGADNLIRRAFASDGCDWDKKNASLLLTSVVKPEQVRAIFLMATSWFGGQLSKNSAMEMLSADPDGGGGSAPFDDSTMALLTCSNSAMMTCGMTAKQ
jgi:hypothetical protein